MKEESQKYKDIDLKDFLKELVELEKKGVTTVQLNGTILVKEDGNSVLATTEKQW